MTVRDVKTMPSLWRMSLGGLAFGRNDTDDTLERPAEIDLNFAQDTYMLAGSAVALSAVTTFARPTSQPYTDSAGDPQTALANEPRVVHHIGGDPVGLLFDSALSETLQIDTTALTTAFGTMPAGISIAASGLITYDDDDTPSQAKITDWVGANGFLVNKLVTTGAAVGTIQFRQNDTISTVSLEAVDAYAPGTLLPFSFAVSNTASGVAAADQGVDLGQSAAGGVPDMLADALRLLTVFEGTLSRVRVWGHDIGVFNRNDYSL